MDESKSRPKESKKKRRYDQEQYEMLKRCSERRDITEWNNWREANPDENIRLEGAALTGANLARANLQNANLWEADLLEADLKGANLGEACLQGAKLMRANIEGAEFGGAELQAADFSRAIIDGGTLIWRCKSDERTKFEGVALGNMRIYPREKQRFEYNIRRMNWEEWYKKGGWWGKTLKRIFVWPFWLISDYGKSTGQIIATFFGLAFVFALAYRLWPGFVMVNGKAGGIRGLWHALYFSVVTMTTLGFGDIAANPDSWGGQGLLMLQVVLGYVLLGALVTRFAVLFTAGGPAGRFESREREGSGPRPVTGWDELVGDKSVLQVGDVIHVQGRGWFSRAIRFFSRGWKERPSWASHSAMVLQVGEEIEIIEALWKTAIRPITAYKGKRSRLLVCRKPGGIDEEEKQRMVNKAEYYEGKPYGFWEIAFHVLDRLVNNAYFFRRLIKDDDYPICSWLVAYVYKRVLGYRFGTPPKAAQPDDILDHCVDKDWEFVWADSKETVKNFCKIYDLQDK